MIKHPCRFFSVAFLSIVVATVMYVAPARADDLQSMANQTVASKIVVGRPRVILLEGVPKLVGNVVQNRKYELSFAITNTGSQLTFAPAEFRVQGLANQVEFYSDSSFQQALPPDYQGKPRVTLTTSRLGPGNTSITGCFVARKNMATKDMSFNVGFYATVVPKGRHWVTSHPYP